MTTGLHQLNSSRIPAAILPLFLRLHKVLNYVQVNFILGPFAKLQTATIGFVISACRGHAVAQLVEALRYKPEGRGFDSR